MMLSANDVAKLVGKSPGFVRQHFRRQQLSGERRGRRLWFRFAEVRQWARAQGLPLSGDAMAALLRERGESPQPSERLRVLRVRAVCRVVEGRYLNLVTTLRERWVPLAEVGALDSPRRLEHEAGEGIEILGVDLDASEVGALLDAARGGLWALGGTPIHFSLGAERRHFVGGGEAGCELLQHGLSSPFGGSGAWVDEWWADIVPEALTTEEAEALSALRGALGIDLGTYSDRLGNLLHFQAADTVRVQLRSEGPYIRLLTQDPVEPGHWRASVVLYQEDDVVFRRCVTLDSASVVVPAPEHDAYMMTVFDADGTAAQHEAFYMIREVRMQTAVQVGPEKVVRKLGRDIGRVRGRTHRGESVVRADESMIRARQSARRARQLDAPLRKKRQIERFHDHSAARAYFGALLEGLSRDNEIVYLADRHFFSKTVNHPDMERLLLVLCDAAQGRELRILHTGGGAAEGWREVHPQLRAGLRARSVRRVDPERGPQHAFHDRFIATRSDGALFTHSVRDWDDGVTFVGGTGPVYFEEAEGLWNRPRGKGWEVWDLW